MSDLVKRAFYPHPPEVVWAALTDRDALAQWLMPNNFVPEVGREFEFRIDPVPFMGNVISCRVLELTPPTKMVWSWRICRTKGRGVLDTEIRWELSPHEGGTRLTLTQAKADGLPWLLRMMMTMGWGTMLKRWLPKVAARFERTGAGLVYRRMEKAPNRGHHGVKTVPADFAK